MHAIGYYLDPELCYEEKFSNVDEVRRGLFECIDKMLNYHDCLKANIQLDAYDHVEGKFGSHVAIDSQKLKSPTSWWMLFKGSTLELQKFTVRVFSVGKLVNEKNMSNEGDTTFRRDTTLGLQGYK